MFYTIPYFILQPPNIIHTIPNFVVNHPVWCSTPFQIVSYNHPVLYSTPFQILSYNHPVLCSTPFQILSYNHPVLCSNHSIFYLIISLYYVLHHFKFYRTITLYYVLHHSKFYLTVTLYYVLRHSIRCYFLKLYVDEPDGAADNSTNLSNFARIFLSAGAELFCWQPCTPLSKANNQCRCWTLLLTTLHATV